MSTPGFTADASLYRTSNHYRSSGSGSEAEPGARAVVAAYHPGPGTQRSCSDCLESCAKQNVICNAVAMTTIWFPPALAVAFTACATEAAACLGYCTVPVLGKCCPKVCGFPNPLEPGEGCCDEGETCVDRYDPNSRQGCCPSDQSVCAGKCCPAGHTCCGNTCCPGSYYCRDGVCSEFPGPLWPDDWKPQTPKKSLLGCRAGHEPCGGTCCPPGLQCCSVGGGVSCMTTCLH
jgi:hypothetical protein